VRSYNLFAETAALSQQFPKTLRI